MQAGHKGEKPFRRIVQHSLSMCIKITFPVTFATQNLKSEHQWRWSQNRFLYSPIAAGSDEWWGSRICKLSSHGNQLTWPVALNEKLQDVPTPPIFNFPSHPNPDGLQQRNCCRVEINKYELRLPFPPPPPTPNKLSELVRNYTDFSLLEMSKIKDQRNNTRYESTRKEPSGLQWQLRGKRMNRWLVLLYSLLFLEV